MVNIGRVSWPGLVGIGAGIIKGASAMVDYAGRASALELGSITQELCLGNAGQTVWKYAAEKGLRHNAGMPNPGAAGLVKLILPVQAQVTIPWGINVAVTPGIKAIDLAVTDIKQTVKTLLTGGLKPHWLTVNVASPDTEDKVEDLGSLERIRAILTGLRGELEPNTSPPLWLKITPAMQTHYYLDLARMLTEQSLVEAVIAANTLPDPRGLPGGWGGEPARAKTIATVWQMKQLCGDKIPIIGCGGIMTGKQAKMTLSAGARAVMIVSATLFRGRDTAKLIEAEIDR